MPVRTNYTGYQTWVNISCLHFCDKNVVDTSTQEGAGIFSEYQQLANELHRPITRNIQRPKVYSANLDNILGTDLVNMQLVIFFPDIYDKQLTKENKFYNCKVP